MEHSDFEIGMVFHCGGRRWRCTDKGARTIVAIRLDGINVGHDETHRILSFDEAEAEGWFNGPPYAVAEYVFDENDLPGCW